MTQLNLGYSEIENMPFEFVEWFYKRKAQDIIDQQESRNKGNIPTFFFFFYG